MKWGGKWYYMEADESGVRLYNEDPNVVGGNYVKETKVPYSEILGVKYIDGGGILPWIAVILDVKGKSYPMSLSGENPYKIKICGAKNRQPALAIKKYIESMIGK